MSDLPRSATRTAPTEVTFFESPEEFRAWLAANHETASELWMGLRKKHIHPRGLTWAEAVPEALCYGWIDSVVQRLDDDSVRQRWSPRKKGSTWSKVNLASVEELMAQGRMQPAGLAAYQARHTDRQVVYAYEQADIGWPDDLAARLDAEEVAAAFWAAAPASYRKMAIYWVLSAKQDKTRESRFASLVEDCAAGRLIRPQRYGEEPSWAGRARARLGLPEPA